MKKMVVMMYVYDEGSNKRIMKTVAKFPGITTITMDSRDGKLTVLGEFDSLRILTKLKRRWRNAKMASFGPYEPTTATADSERTRFEAYRENHSRYSPMQHHCSVGDHHYYHGCIIS